MAIARSPAYTKRVRQLGWALLLLLGAAGCGGKSNSSDDPAVGGTAGSSSVGGSGSMPRDCQLGGDTYAHGTSFQAPDGCNTCSCDDGEIGCTEIGCNPVDQCSSISESYQALLERAKTCDVHGENECTLLVPSGLACGCETFVNPRLFSKGAVAAVTDDFAANGCGQVVCGPCPPPPLRGACGADGQCKDEQDLRGERACKVGGTIYPSGSAVPIQDPFSCNQCSCQDGELVCDDAICPKPCPDDTKPGKGCAQCGPTDDCEVVEIDCMPACVDTCAQGTCVDGACVNYCG